MKTRSILISLLLTFLLPAYAQQEITPLSILGTWRITVQHPSGTSITSTVRFMQSMKFTSSTSANEKPLMEANGTWKIEGNLLTWNYEYSSHPAISPGYSDTDEILNVTDNEIRLKSKMSGRIQDWQRVR